MVNRRELKTRSKEQLRGQWTTVVLITLGICVLEFIIVRIINSYELNGNYSISFSLLNTLVTISIPIFTYTLYLKLTRGVKVKVSDMFVSGRTYLKAIGVTLLQMLMFIPAIIVTVMVGTAIIIGLISAIGIADSIFIPSDIQYLFYSYSFIEVLRFVGVILIVFLVISIPIMILGIYLYPCIILMCEDDSRGVGECIGMSFRLMSGNVWSYFVLQLSYVGWALLCILTLGIGYLWLIPYINTVNMNFFNEITGYDNNLVDNPNIY